MARTQSQTDSLNAARAAKAKRNGVLHAEFVEHIDIPKAESTVEQEVHAEEFSWSEFARLCGLPSLPRAICGMVGAYLVGYGLGVIAWPIVDYLVIAAANFTGMMFFGYVVWFLLTLCIMFAAYKLGGMTFNAIMATTIDETISEAYDTSTKYIGEAYDSTVDTVSGWFTSAKAKFA